MKRVLYAEDSVASQALMRRYLKGLCEVVIAPTPDDATVLLGSEPFAALITDFAFEEGDAAGLITNARKSRSVTELPIVVVSSCMDKLLATRVLSAGANEVAAKPLHPADFRALIERMLTQPYVAKQDLRSISVPVLQWQAGDEHHQFCPEFDVHVKGVSDLEAGRAMLTALKAQIATGRLPVPVRHTKLVTHTIDY